MLLAGSLLRLGAPFVRKMRLCHKFYFLSADKMGTIGNRAMEKRSESPCRTAEAAKMTGISSRTLYRMLVDGRIAGPSRGHASRYRQWSGMEVRAIPVRHTGKAPGKGTRG